MSSINTGDLKIKQNKCIFDAIEEINAKYGVELANPVNVPEGSSFACYSIEDLFNIKFVQFYREDDLGLCYYNFNTEAWYLVNEILEKEILEDFMRVGSKYIYLRLTKREDDKPKFTPGRLLGVETTLGFITTMINDDTVMLSRNNDYFYNLNLLKYYISDDSDETVSLDEYIKLFYNTENTL